MFRHALTRAASSAAIAIAVLCPSLSQAQVWDFQSELLGPYAGGTTTISSGGVSALFSANGLQIRDLSPFGFGPGSDRVMSSLGDQAVITMQLQGGATATGVTFRNIIYGFYTSEVDEITMNAYDGIGNLLGTVTGTSEFLTITASGIASVTWDDGGTGYVIDDVTLRGTSTSVVPEPGTYALLASGLAMVGAFARRRRQA